MTRIFPRDEVILPCDLWYEGISAFRLIGRLMKWEGAQIGKLGYVLSYIQNIEHSPIEPIYTKMFLPYSVTFETSDQCLAAWKAECPELFK